MAHDPSIVYVSLEHLCEQAKLSHLLSKVRHFEDCLVYSQTAIATLVRETGKLYLALDGMFHLLTKVRGIVSTSFSSCVLCMYERNSISA